MILFGLYSFAIGWRGTHDLERVQVEMWNDGLVANEVQLFQETVFDMSERAIGSKNGISIDQRLLSQSLTWTLRNQVKENNENIEFIVTSKTVQIESFTEEYRGQSFSIQSYPNWSEKTFDQWLDWFVYRDIDQLQQEVISMGTTNHI